MIHLLSWKKKMIYIYIKVWLGIAIPNVFLGLIYQSTLSNLFKLQQPYWIVKPVRMQHLQTKTVVGVAIHHLALN